MRSGSGARALTWLIVVLVGLVLVDVLVEGWVLALLTRPGGGPPGWPKLVKNGLFLALAALTVASVLVRRRWRDFTTRADLALLVLALVMVVAGVVGGSPPRLIGQALFVYFRGVIVFYALRAADPPGPWLRRIGWVLAGIIGLNVAVALVQMLVGIPAFTAVGWTDLTWAKIDRAQGLLTHPNHLGHVLGLALLGLLAAMVTRPRVRWPWWAAFAAGALALSATQSRESVLACAVGAGLLWLLARGGRRILAAVAVLLLCAAAQVLLRPANLAEWQRRMSGVVNAVAPTTPPASPAPHPSGGAKVGTAKPKPPQREIRILMYQQGLRLLWHEPILGYGVGQFGGIVAQENNPNWNLNPRFGPGGFDRHGFVSKQVDSFWLHLVVETGLLGLLAYLCWLYLLIRPLLPGARRRPDRPADPYAAWAVVALAFVVQVAFLSASLEDEVLPALLFALLGVAWTRTRRQPTPPVAEPELVAVR